MSVVRIHKDEWYPVYEEGDWDWQGIEIDVTDDVLKRLRRAMKAFKRVQAEMHDLYEAQCGDARPTPGEVAHYAALEQQAVQ